LTGLKKTFAFFDVVLIELKFHALVNHVLRFTHFSNKEVTDCLKFKGSLTR